MIRPGGRRPGHVGIADESGRPTGNPLFESMLADTEMLARRLAEDMRLEGRAVR